jgi:hypothetical protein
MTRTPCFLCLVSAGTPGPRQCPVCAGTGYVVTDDLAPPIGGADENYDPLERGDSAYDDDCAGRARDMNREIRR